MRNDRLIVALDLPDGESALRMVDMLRDRVGIYKIGMELFYSEGAWLISELASRGVDVFLDLKFHDIPNTVGSAVRQLSRLRPAMMTVHAPGGSAMMSRAVKAAEETGLSLGFRPMILAITLLTSIDERALRGDLMVRESPTDYVLAMARLSQAAGVDGVVASPHEARMIRECCGEGFRIVTPGIRPTWFGHGDQRRVATPYEAILAGADHIVVGRPVTQSDDPVGAVSMIVDEIDRASEARGTSRRSGSDAR
ncbi:MAG: orotidine-5'-phosphate decarboxylase [Firmicutes bacterium]|nr:orotidine-5'-phosphate decarboxylase [Bacillota bacterium]